MIQQMKNEGQAVIESCISIAYFMRGAIQYDEVLMRCNAERQLMLEFLNNRMEIESKRSNPIY